MTSDRTCARPGCMTRGKHFASCPDYGKTDGDCRGCVPSEARDGAIICERCYRAVRGAITDAPDLVGHLRSIADPTKSSWNFDRLSGGSRAELPAPVQAAIIADNVAATLMFHDQDAAHEMLRSFRHSSFLAAATVYDRQDVEFAAYRNGAVDEMPSLLRDWTLFTPLSVARPIRYRGMALGRFT